MLLCGAVVDLSSVSPLNAKLKAACRARIARSDRRPWRRVQSAGPCVRCASQAFFHRGGLLDRLRVSLLGEAKQLRMVPSLGFFESAAVEAEFCCDRVELRDGGQGCHDTLRPVQGAQGEIRLPYGPENLLHLLSIGGNHRWHTHLL